MWLPQGISVLEGAWLDAVKRSCQFPWSHDRKATRSSSKGHWWTSGIKARAGKHFNQVNDCCQNFARWPVEQLTGTDPNGRYKVEVNNYSQAMDVEVPFRVVVTHAGSQQEIHKTMPPGEGQVVLINTYEVNN